MVQSPPYFDESYSLHKLSTSNRCFDIFKLTAPTSSSLLRTTAAESPLQKTSAQLFSRLNHERSRRSADLVPRRSQRLAQQSANPPAQVSQHPSGPILEGMETPVNTTRPGEFCTNKYTRSGEIRKALGVQNGVIFCHPAG